MNVEKNREIRTLCGTLGHVAALAGLTLGAVGCDDAIDLTNARPRVVQVAVAPAVGDTTTLTLWVADAEGEPVDVDLTWSAGGSTGEVLLAPGSAPLLGLPTELGLNASLGQEHAITWDLSGVPSGAVTLILNVDDRPFDDTDGDSYRVDGLDPRAGSAPIAAIKQ